MTNWKKRAMEEIDEIEKSIQDVVKLIDQSLPNLQERTENFRVVIEKASQNASSINMEIKRIERTQTRISQVLDTLLKAKEQRSVLQKCKDAFRAKDFDNTVRHFIQLKSYGTNCSRLMNDEISVLEKTIRTEFSSGLKGATEKGDMKQTLRYTDLLMRIGFEDEGLQQYVLYYTGLINNEASSIKEKLLRLDIATIKTNAVFAESVKGFADFSLKLVMRQSAIKAEEIFKPDIMYTIVSKMYSEISTSMLMLLNTFSTVRRINALQQVKPKDMSEQEVIIVLDEMSMISSVFVVCKMKMEEYLGNIKASEEVKKKPVDSLVKVVNEMEKAMNTFMIIQENYITMMFSKNIKEKVKIGEYSEVLDLIFYELQQSANRVVISGSFQTSCAVLNLIVTTIKTYLLNMTKQVVRDNTSFNNVKSSDVLKKVDDCKLKIQKLHSSISVRMNDMWRNNEKSLEMINIGLDELLDTQLLFDALKA
ncbi:hypothetical protein EIN_053180 [Entamoeba invadens IP1]|uniref:hypothetical protein n=1 Tax=Entamoeba invadens IP1 TaxID=370355 RepID=UPI0002C3F7C2|nr:hypothetical protein EIN_053180 [Entamoeba invadens IP1]ELP93083.1 hypothetical protein EIN_053180 [Entamoeba invadens IP1]|eukprot:XP_004259854.1 hypothetical protein EIN_053180 [Entamoeba invadens IP1]